MENAFLVAFMVLSFVFSIVFVYGNIRSRRLAKQEISKTTALKKRGVTIEGRIVRHSHPSIFLAPVLIYSYQHEGVQYQKKQLVIRKDFKNAVDGEVVSVCYLTQQPDVAIIANMRNVAGEAYHSYLAINCLYLAISFVILFFVCIVRIIIINHIL